MQIVKGKRNSCTTQTNNILKSAVGRLTSNDFEQSGTKPLDHDEKQND